MAVEKELEKTENVPQPNAVFDESSNFLIYATLLGIKVCLTALVPFSISPLYLVLYVLPVYYCYILDDT